MVKPASKANTKLILAEEDNIQHILASLALKVTRQSVIIPKLSSYPRKNRTKKALWELDNLRRSLHLLNYVDSPQFQRNIQRALNRGESYHKHGVDLQELVNLLEAARSRGAAAPD